MVFENYGIKVWTDQCMWKSCLTRSPPPRRLNLFTAVIIETFEATHNQEDWKLSPQSLEQFVTLWWVQGRRRRTGAGRGGGAGGGGGQTRARPALIPSRGKHTPTPVPPYDDGTLHLSHILTLFHTCPLRRSQYDDGSGTITPKELEELLMILEPPLGLGLQADNKDVLR